MKSRVLFLVFLTVFLDFVGLGIILPVLPFYVQAMGGSAQTVGWLLASFSLTQFLATPVFGSLSDRCGRRLIIAVSLAGQMTSMVAFAWGTKLQLLPILFLARVFSGATAGNVATCQAVVADVTSGPERARGMGRVGAGIGLGFVAGPILGGTLSPLGPAAPALAAAGLALVGLVAVLLWMPETRDMAAAVGDRVSSGRAVTFPAHLLRDSRVIRSLLIYFLAFAGMTGLQVAAALLGQERLGWAEREAGYAFTLFGIVMVIVQVGLVGWFTRVMGELNAMRAGSIGMAAGMAGLAAAHSNAFVVGALVVLAAGMALISAVVPSKASTYAGPAEQGAVLGVLQSAGGLARAVGPVWAGFLCARFTPSAPFVFASVMAVVSYAVATSLPPARHS